MRRLLITLTINDRNKLFFGNCAFAYLDKTNIIVLFFCYFHLGQVWTISKNISFFWEPVTRMFATQTRSAFLIHFLSVSYPPSYSSILSIAELMFSRDLAIYDLPPHPMHLNISLSSFLVRIQVPPNSCS